MFFNNSITRIIKDSKYLKTFEILFKNTEGATGRALAVLVGVSVFKMNQVLRDLVQQGIVLQTSIGKAHLYRLNKLHVFREIISYLIRFDETLLSSLGKKIMRELTPKPLSIIVYGSVARGEEKPNSDLDLLFVYDGKSEPGGITKTGHILEMVSRHYGNPASIIRAYFSDLQRPREEHSSLMRNIIKEGRSIAGLSITEILNYHD